jgi:Fe-S-cluster containining protein
VDLLSEKLNNRKEATASFLEELTGIFEDMDRQYRKTADQYGFECRGCENNCCLTRFYHHTVLEYAFLMEGFKTLDLTQQEKIRAEAREVVLNCQNADTMNLAVRVMCPLNERGLCVLYQRRPMICRLHGLPHEFKKANGRKLHGPGCEAFDRQCKTPYIAFDRTPFYTRMASLEQRVRDALGYHQKIKLTIADMVASSKT